jgi:hypothetical protein
MQKMIAAAHESQKQTLSLLAASQVELLLCLPLASSHVHHDAGDARLSQRRAIINDGGDRTSDGHGHFTVSPAERRVPNPEPSVPTAAA